ncbi:hypothetical protein PU634_10590 [Oceanimonas pelagia]|uniref:Uncharacterized protein n=1 Tax=Oceanimonas pelagia TaxID=3028314 RepID=A0AA50QAX9_9GAMM|nr:hypothetical protein [Oceanimonas pelagia]WMC09564.1 hypothetical protein PU634_10590 [Oceanimonas pelagia]
MTQDTDNSNVIPLPPARLVTLTADKLEQSIIKPARIYNNMPSTFRLALYPDGRKVIQGGYVWSEGFQSGIEWKDLPVVEVDEHGKAEGD